MNPRTFSPFLIALFLITSSAWTADEVDRALTALDRLDAAAVTIDCVDTELRDVVEILNEASPVAITMEWEALTRLSVGSSDWIELHLDALRISDALDHLMLQLGDEFERPVWDLHAGQVVITTQHGLERMRLVEVYDVRDLLVDGEWTRYAEQLNQAPESEGDEASEAEEIDDRPASMRIPESPGEELMMLIARHLDPDAWMEFGGMTATISDHEGQLLVTAPARMHKGFHDVLDQMRSANPSTIMFEAMILDIPRAEYDRLVRIHGRGGATLGRALMADTLSETLWRASSAVAIGEMMAVDSESNGRFVTMEVTPTVDSDTGVLTIALSAKSNAEGDQRSVRTKVKLPDKRSAIVVELPGVEAGKTIRLVTLVPYRM